MGRCAEFQGGALVRARLPELVKRKIYKTGQTRGADDDQIFQNRVGRNSVVLIPHSVFSECRVPSDGTGEYEKGFIVLVSPSWYYSSSGSVRELADQGLELGQNALLFFDRRSDWEDHNPNRYGLQAATSRIAPLGGTYVARVPANTARDGGLRENHGFTTTRMKGAGIRVYEYASTEAIRQTRLQLEALFWSCSDAIEAVTEVGMDVKDAEDLRNSALRTSEKADLFDRDRLVEARILNDLGGTTCPLCLLPISARGFMSRVLQAPGRETYDLTITEVSLFHIEELRVGQLGHRPYNLGWGHHHCNVVAKDSGIQPTLSWMREVLDRNQ